MIRDTLRGDDGNRGGGADEPVWGKEEERGEEENGKEEGAAPLGGL